MESEGQTLPAPNEMTEEERKNRIKELLAELKELRSIPQSDWHREFENALQLDVESWGNGSWVMREHTLGEDAPRIDFIVVSGDELPEDVKEIFRIFRHKNVIEFKGPGDKLTLLTLRKVAGYTNFYIATAKPEENVKIGEVTATIFASEKDNETFEILEKSGQLEKTDVEGIYRVKDILDMPFQIVMTNELKGAEYAAYRVLKAQVDEKDVDYLLEELKTTTDQTKRERLRGLLGIVETKHTGMVWQKIKEDGRMKDVFWDLFKPQIDEQINEQINERINERISSSRRNDLYRYVQSGGMTVDFAAHEAGITVDQFKQQMDEYNQSNRSHNLQPA